MLCVRAKPPTLRGPPLALAVLCGLLAVQHVAGQALPAGCTGALVGVYDDSKPPHRILPVISSAGGAANPNPKACPACLPSGKTWSITDPKINCPTAANACPALDPKKMTPEVCMAACTSFGQFRYAGVEDGDQCFCGDVISPKTVKPAASNNMKCTGDPTKMCGAASIMAVYEISCKTGDGADSDLAEHPWGWLFVAVLLGVSSLYLLGFTAYNVKAKGLSGAAALPHTAFWSDTAGLVADGVIFAASKARRGRGDGGDGGEFTDVEAGVDGDAVGEEEEAGVKQRSSPPKRRKSASANQSVGADKPRRKSSSANQSAGMRKKKGASPRKELLLAAGDDDGGGLE